MRPLSRTSHAAASRQKNNNFVVPTFVGLQPRSAATSQRARAASRKRDTKPEMLLRSCLHAYGLCFRVVSKLPGKPDIVFPRLKIAIFVDGDFWHGRNLKTRVAKLARGHNAPYWSAKIMANHARDIRTRRKLRAKGWKVVRVWEGDIRRSPTAARDRIVALLRNMAAACNPRC